MQGFKSTASTDLFGNFGPEKLSIWSSLIFNSKTSYFTESAAGPGYTLLCSAVEYVQGKIHQGVSGRTVCQFSSLGLRFSATAIQRTNFKGMYMEPQPVAPIKRIHSQQPKLEWITVLWLGFRCGMRPILWYRCVCIHG